MFKYISLMIVCFVSLNIQAQCNDELLGEAAKKLDNFVYIRDFKLKLKEVKKKKDQKYATYTVILNKDKQYRFVLESAKEYEGKLIFDLFGDRGKIVSSYNESTQKHYPVVQYDCKKTGVHYINLEFSGSKEGCGVLVYSFKKTTMDELLSR